MSEDQFIQVMAKLAVIGRDASEANRLATEANSIARGTAVQMAIMFGEMDKLAKRMDSLETATLGRRQ